MPRPRPGVNIDSHVLGSAWQDRGACAGLNPDVFFPPDAEGVDVAKQICATCTVRPECLEYALAFKEKHGVWGGTSEHERRRIAKQRNKQCAA